MQSTKTKEVIFVLYFNCSLAPGILCFFGLRKAQEAYDSVASLEGSGPLHDAAFMNSANSLVSQGDIAVFMEISEENSAFLLYREAAAR